MDEKKSHRKICVAKIWGELTLSEKWIALIL
jgi:hypothetical protein